jgi:hypothetical protein
MPTNTFNEAEKYLLENWQQACRVEKSLKKLRNKYVEITDGVLEPIQEEYPTLDRCENLVKSDACIIIGRESWQCDGRYAYIGMEYLDVDSLWDDNAEHPFIGIWTGKPKKPVMDVKAIKRLLTDAETILPKDVYDECQWECSPDKLKASECSYQYQLWYTLPQERKELRSMIVDGDGQKFVDCLVSHFRVFAKFIPVLDAVFPEPEEE